MARKAKNTIKIKRFSKMTVDGKTFLFYPGDVWTLVEQYPGNPERKEVCRHMKMDLQRNQII